MRYMAMYDLMETARNTNQWLGATALALGSYPMWAWCQTLLSSCSPPGAR